jgi:chromosome segregation ATPase
MKEVRSENERLTEEVDHCKMTIRSLEIKYNDQKRLVDTVDVSRSESTSRINELKACNELLERQMMDLTSENKTLVAEKEKQRILITDLSSENEKQSTTIGELRQTNERKTAKCNSLEQSLVESREQITSLEQEKKVHTVQTNHLIDTKERHHSELINVYEQKLAASKDEAATAIKSAQNDVNALSSECNNLRSRILQLQRDNFRLEHELMDAQQQKQRQGNFSDDTNAKLEGANHEAEKLREENKALKEVINMMRNEMESAVSEESRAEATDETALLERQLSLCRSYLDLLLNSSNKRLTKYDELSFLRTKNRELLSVIDELRHEGLGHNQSSQPHGTPSVHEQQLISQLEEATDQIDTLLQERDQLMKLSNELKFELHQALSTNEGQKRSSARMLNEGQQQSSRLEPQEDEAAGHILDAILNDFSATSCDGESHEESEVACIGMKPPRGNITSVSNCSPRIKLFTSCLILHLCICMFSRHLVPRLRQIELQ